MSVCSGVCVGDSGNGEQKIGEGFGRRGERMHVIFVFDTNSQS